MKLEGSLDAFSLPDIFRLLAFTQKTGALHLTGQGGRGLVHFVDGSITGAAEESRQGLALRLIAAAELDEPAIERVLRAAPSSGLVKALVGSGAIEAELLAETFADHVVDVVCELLRWDEGAFVFSIDEPNLEDAGLVVDVDQVVSQAKDRLERWGALRAKAPSPDAVLALAWTVQQEAILSPDEWRVLGLIDGQRPVRDIAWMAGGGEFRVTAALAALLERGLVASREERDQAMAAVQLRQELLARLEGKPAQAESSGPERVREISGVLYLAEEETLDIEMDVVTDFGDSPSERSIAMTTAFVSEVPVAAQPAVVPARPAQQLGPVLGSVVAEPLAQPETLESADHLEQDGAVNKSLLLRLIAGVRSL